MLAKMERFECLFGMANPKIVMGAGVGVRDFDTHSFTIFRFPSSPHTFYTNGYSLTVLIYCSSCFICSA